jgi:hypothetical protein
VRGGGLLWGQWPIQEIGFCLAEGVLAKHGVALHEFHATEMVRARRYQPMLLELAQVISEYRVYPVSFGIVVDNFNSYNENQRKFITGARLDEKTGKFLSSGCPNKPYFVPFSALPQTSDDLRTCGR